MATDARLLRLFDSARPAYVPSQFGLLVRHIASIWLFSACLFAIADGHTAGSLIELVENIAALERGIDLHAESLDTPGFGGYTALHHAVDQDSVAAAAALLCRGANPNVYSDAEEYGDCLTPLHLAVSQDHFVLTELLLEKGANPRLLVKGSGAMRGLSPFQLAAFAKSERIMELLRAINPDLSLHEAASGGLQDRFLEIVAREGKGVVRKRDAGGNTLWHAAAGGNQVAILTDLLPRFGCELNTKNDLGWFPLHVACDYGNVAAAKALLDLGADVNLTGKLGETPLYIAALQALIGKRDTPQLFRVLVEA